LFLSHSWRPARTAKPIVKGGLAQTRVPTEQGRAAAMMLNSKALPEPLCDPVSSRTHGRRPNRSRSDRLWWRTQTQV